MVVKSEGGTSKTENVGDDGTSAVADLLRLMARLRDPEVGCPWDIKQTFLSITPSTIEEAYEVVDAIERHDMPHLREELGDLLFQVVFYCQLGQEQGLFDFYQVAGDLVEKLLRRHPHVFPEGTLDVDNNGPRSDEEAVKANWEKIKEQERSGKGSAGVLDDIPTAFPAVTRALKLQKRASRVGFDWSDVSEVFKKVEEELGELREAAGSGNSVAVADEVGDLLFTVVNLARHLKVEPESSLRAANNKFERRFRAIENALARQGTNLADTTPEVMEELWNKAKLSGL